MSEIMAIANQKGGVGKTTTTINLSAALAEQGKRVLIIDMDPQGNTSSGLGIDKDELETTVYQLMIGDNSFDECVQKDVFENLDVLAANVNLAGIEIETMDMEDRNYILRDIISEVEDKYDFIIIDCPPSLNTLTINSMTTADSVLVPIQCEYYALEGLSQLIYTINLVKDRLNPKLTINGVVFTMYDGRTNLSMQVIENVRNNLNQTIYDTIIPRGVRLAEAPSHGLPITQYDNRSTGAKAYMALAKEVIERSAQELSDSIKQHGIVQPLVVAKKDDYFEIIAGERRWRAAKLAGLKEVPVVIKDYSPQEIMEVALIENIQREDLNPVEEAKAYQNLIKEYNLKQEEVAERVSKSRSAITNSLRLLKLSDDVLTLLMEEEISSGHARALLGLEDNEKQLEIAEKIAKDHLSVREVEKLVKNINQPAKKTKKKELSNDFLYHDMEEKVKLKTGTKVRINRKSENKGKIEIEYYSQDDLEKILGYFK